MSFPAPEYRPSQGPTTDQHAGPQNYYGTTEPGSYTRPPPSYADDEALLRSSSPRTPGDSVPDDFKFGGMVADAPISIRQAFVRKVYAILTVQLLATAGVCSISFFSAGFKSWIQGNTWMVFVSFFLSLGLLVGTWWKRRSYPANLLFLAGFTVVEAYTVAVVTSFYDVRIVLEAVGITGVIFIGLTVFACQTKYDVTGWQGWLSGALWMLIVFGIVGAFFPGRTVELVYAGASAVIFSIYVVVDTQIIMGKCHVEEEIVAAVSLYLDVINLFLAILRLVNSSDN